METLNLTEPHYIRCVKPNNLLQPTVFDNANVLHQLRSGVSVSFELFITNMFWCLEVLYDLCLTQGVLEAIRVKCAGYPTNRTFIEFLKRFIILAPEILKGEYVSVELSSDIVCLIAPGGFFISVSLPIHCKQVWSRCCMQVDFGQKGAYRFPSKAPSKLTKYRW